ncbi:hypothetical protein HF086_006425 [Spodoptera exigua]|uniref:Uncharacterized protein n=1 Tax=Spodoptera exigua TaxID=7107 RepID=A0A922MX54_SPOEX|nr:hypothetical protein HF086_006425 [Spodoptera exigua]
MYAHDKLCSCSYVPICNLALFFTVEERRVYKNIKRLYRTRFNKMNACRMFYVDAMLPFAIITLTSYYCIVLLQFALL